VKEAQLKETAEGLVPEDDGWYVLNTKDAVWYDSRRASRRSASTSRFSSVGARNGRPGLLYPVDEMALSHGAGVERETTQGDEAYAGTSEVTPIRYVEGDLPAA